MMQKQDILDKLSRCMQVDTMGETGTYQTKNDVILNQQIQQYNDTSLMIQILRHGMGIKFIMQQ